MTPDVINSFLMDSYFTQGTVTVTGKDFYYNKGHVEYVSGATTTLRQKKILVPVKEKDLVDAGLGEYVGNESFTLFTKTPLVFSSGAASKVGDIITYKNKKYKIISQLDFETHGFYKYLITKLKDDELND